MLNFLTTTTVCGFSLYHVLAFFLIYSRHQPVQE